jgi:cobalt-zinc-cadmium efflux system membrane fusion protein
VGVLPGLKEGVMRGWVGGLVFVALAVFMALLGVSLTQPQWVLPWARRVTDRFYPRSWFEEPDDDDEDRDRKRETAAAVGSGGGGSLRDIKLASPELARRIGIETAVAVTQRHAHRLTCNADTAYDGRRTAEVLPRVAGVLRAVKVDLGQEVKRGEVLAMVDSAQVGAAKAQYLMAKAAAELAGVTYDRTVKLTEARAAPAKNELEALTALNQAKAARLDAEQKLRNLSFTDADLARVAKEQDTSNLLEVTAPIAGTITAWDATLGEAVEPTTQLFALADMARMWLWIDVYEQDIARVASGQPVTFTISGTKEPVFRGKVTWVGTEVNATTRTARVRAEVANERGRVRANQFGLARIELEPEHDALVVPRSAVQDDGDLELVFVPRAPGVYHPQRVKTAPTERDDVVEIVRGLEPGQQVVTARAYVLKSELFRGRLGAADND